MNENLTEKELTAIIKIKSQHWPYDIASHRKWMHDNLCSGDIHLCLYDEEALVGYLNIVFVNILINDALQSQLFLGIGNVCIETTYLKTNTGKALMHHANKFIMDQRMQGILFCKDNLLGFYKKCDWCIVKNPRIHCQSQVLLCNCLLFNYKDFLLVSNITTNRIF